MKSKVVFTAILYFILVVPLEGKDSVRVQGFDIPSPVHRDWILDGSSIKYSRFPIEYDLAFFLSSDGCIDSLTYVSGADDSYIKSAMYSLENMDFTVPAYDGVPMPFILPARLKFLTRRYNTGVILELPYTPSGNVYNRSLINQALLCNDYIAPLLKKVGPYYCELLSQPAAEDYPFVIYRFGLDSLGDITACELIFENNRYLADKIFPVLLHAEYSPAEFRGRKIPSELFVTTRFFTGIGYPTGPWPPEIYPEVKLTYDFNRIDARPYLDSIVCPPFPSNLYQRKLVSTETFPFNDSLSYDIKIDTLGKIILSRLMSEKMGHFRDVSEEMLYKLEFLPARDFRGNKISFEGTVWLKFDNSKRIRIEANWLTEAPAPFIQ